MDINVFMARLVFILEIMVIYVCPAIIIFVVSMLLYFFGSWMIYRRMENKCDKE